MQNDIAALTEAQVIRQFEPLMEAWDKMGYIDNKYAPPLATDYDRAMMAVCLENVKNYMVGPGKTVEEALEIARKAKEMFGDLSEATTPTTTTAWSGATNLPLVLGYIRKILPKMFALNIVQTQPMTKPSGRVFTLNRIRHDDGTDVGTAEIRYGWSYRSWVDDPGEATTISKSVKFEMTSADVSVKSRKLKAETGIEVEQDLRAYHGFDAVAIVSDAATDEIAMEMDEELLYMIYNNTQVNGAGKFQLGTKPSGYTWEEWDKRVIEILSRASEHVLTYKRVEPNHLICGSEWQIYIERLSAYQPTDEQVAGGGLRPMGTLLSRWNVWKAPLPWPTTTAMLVYKGTTWTDASYYYLPYIPLQLAGVHFDPEKMVRTLSWLSRYATYVADAGQGAWLEIDTANITGLSYPAWTEYNG